MLPRMRKILLLFLTFTLTASETTHMMAATNSVTAGTRSSECCVPVTGTLSRTVKLTDSRKLGI